jgi:hypothetical protein
MRSTVARRLAAAGLALSFIGGVAACGDDDAESAAPDDGTPTAACDAAIDLSTAFSGPPDGDAASWAETSLVPIGERLAELPGDAGSAGETLRSTFAQIAETGDLAAFESPETEQALATVGAAIHRDCGFETVEVEAYDYRYEGLPSQVDAGRVSFSLENKGTEDHEIVIFRRADGVDETLEELMELPEDEVMSKIEFTGVAFGSPGSTTYTAADLAPGTYFVVCFIPVGGGEEGPPHFVEGMSGTFTVS